MMYIEHALKAKTDWWRYVLGTIIIFIGWQALGVIPLTVVAFIVAGNFTTFMDAAQNNFMGLGIDPNLFLFLYILMFTCGLLGVWFSAKFVHEQSFKDLTTTRPNVDWGRIRFSFFMVVIFNLVLFALGYLLEPEAFVWNFDPVPFFILCFVAIFFLPLQTSFEEYLFRGYLMQAFGVAKRKRAVIVLLVLTIISAFFAYLPVLLEMVLPRMGTTIPEDILLMLWDLSEPFKIAFYILAFSLLVTGLISSSKARALIFTSVFFGLLHSLNPEVEKLGYIIMVFYIGTGFLLGIMTLMDDGMELALGFHAGNNIFAAILVTADWTAFQVPSLFRDVSEPSAGFDVVTPVIVLYPIYLFILARRYNWSNWKEKLFGNVREVKETSSVN